MKQGIILLLALCALAAAMVPKEKRAVNTEEEEERLRVQQAETTSKTEFCAPQTPCAWSMYKPLIKIIQTNITNTYCICGPGLSCKMNEDDTAVNAYVYRCRPDSENTEALES